MVFRRRATWDDNLLVVSPEFPEEWLMLLISEASLTVLQSVLVQELIGLDFELDIKERVFDGHNQEVLVFHFILVRSCD